jgi:hypothetical protein
VSATERVALRAFARRQSPRSRLAVPVRVTALREGTAHSVPGRSLDLGEGGIALVLSGELRPADSVSVEFLLPDMGLGLHAKAMVRHCAPSRCGLEFRGLTRHQQAVIREWSRQRLQSPPLRFGAGAELEEQPPLPRSGSLTARLRKIHRLLWSAFLIAAFLGLVLWWQWERAWKKLEEQVSPPVAHVVLQTQPQRFAAAAIPRSFRLQNRSPLRKYV